MRHVEDDDGGGLWIHEMEFDGSPVFMYVPDEEGDAEALLNKFVLRLPAIWAELFSTMKSAFEDYGHPEDFPPSGFPLGIGHMEPDVFVGGESSFFLRFEFEVEKFSDSIPIYDFFLDDGFKIVHHQPVF